MQEKDINKIDLGFSDADYTQISEYGIPLDKIQNQLDFYKNGVAKAVLVEPAKVTNGIWKLSENDFQQKADFFDVNKSNYKLIKFVPASGAASRMFKFLSEFLNDFDIENESINAYINRKKDSELSIFIVGLEKFPFFDQVDTKLREIYPDFENLASDYKNYYFIKTLLSSEYFDFANKPKAVLPFHQYKTHIATPIEEHLYECALYASYNGNSKLHFTVSESHQIDFEKFIDAKKKEIEQETSININVDFSYQNKKTDVLAVDLYNKPFRDEQGKLVFRPGGHGALIENLNELDADVIFIKNIDNVIQNHKKINTLNKKVLAGILLELQQQIFNYLNEMEKNVAVDLSEIISFAKSSLNIKFPEGFSKYTIENKISYIQKKLDRPIRVCGMVKNEGDTGGGPFWVRNAKGNVSLQIVETSQIDLTNADQALIFKQSTHFNPVDLVCGILNHKKERFDLTRFVDHKSGFIVQKNKNGDSLKSYELPGLWNGAMAKWITVFVEVPLITFNPVKTVNDLLKPAHQP